MEALFLTLNDQYTPQILVSNEHFIIVYKPPKMHSAPGKGKSLAEWCYSIYPEIKDLPRNENGLLHRLDYETQGLLLFARNRNSFNDLLEQQNKGKIIKEYGAYVSKASKPMPGFPPFYGTFPRDRIDSYFRPFGPGRREVRPLVSLEKGTVYRTEILNSKLKNTFNTGSLYENTFYIRLRISLGFRHQIRCHLSWAGFPVLNDSVYGGQEIGQGVLALRAENIKFIDPGSGEHLHYSLSPMGLSDL